MMFKWDYSLNVLIVFDPSSKINPNPNSLPMCLCILKIWCCGYLKTYIKHFHFRKNTWPMRFPLRVNSFFWRRNSPANRVIFLCNQHKSSAICCNVAPGLQIPKTNNSNFLHCWCCLITKTEKQVYILYDIASMA